MNGRMLVLALSCLVNACVSASDGISEPPRARAPDLQPTDPVGAGPDEDTPNYMALNENGFNDNDLAPPSASAAGSDRDRDVDGLTRRLYAGWPVNGPASGLVPRLRLSPELIEGLRAALEAENEMIELHNGRDNREDPFDPLTSADWLSTLGANDGGLYEFDSGRHLPKRAPTGFTGMRGRRIPSGFNGMRGKKSVSLFSWNNQAQQSNPKSYRDGKRAPSGFLGMRGKKSIDTSLDEQWSMDDLSLARKAKEYPSFLVLDPTYGPSLHMNPAPYKRVPNGFMGLRGKKDCC